VEFPGLDNSLTTRVLSGMDRLINLPPGPPREIFSEFASDKQAATLLGRLNTNLKERLAEVGWPSNFDTPAAHLTLLRRQLEAEQILADMSRATRSGSRSAFLLERLLPLAIAEANDTSAWISEERRQRPDMPLPNNLVLLPKVLQACSLLKADDIPLTRGVGALTVQLAVAWGPAIPEANGASLPPRKNLLSHLFLALNPIIGSEGYAFETRIDDQANVARTASENPRPEGPLQVTTALFRTEPLKKEIYAVGTPSSAIIPGRQIGLVGNPSKLEGGFGTFLLQVGQEVLAEDVLSDLAAALAAVRQARDGSDVPTVRFGPWSPIIKMMVDRAFPGSEALGPALREEFVWEALVREWFVSENHAGLETDVWNLFVKIRPDRVFDLSVAFAVRAGAMAWSNRSPWHLLRWALLLPNAPNPSDQAASEHQILGDALLRGLAARLSESFANFFPSTPLTREHGFLFLEKLLALENLSPERMKPVARDLYEKAIGPLMQTKPPQVSSTHPRGRRSLLLALLPSRAS